MIDAPAISDERRWRAGSFPNRNAPLAGGRSSPYSPSGAASQGKGTIHLRVKNDDWDSGTDTTQYLIRFHEGANA